MIGLVDANNFYASCERVFRPDLAGRPVAILSNNDGCIIARSNEVKALGIPMAAPYFQVKKILDDHQAAVFSSNFTLYGDISSRMMAILESLAPKVEIYSIDEAFIDFSGIQDIQGLARRIRKQIASSLGIPTSLGIGPTKTLAKVANYWAKRENTDAVAILNQGEAIDQVLQAMKVSDIWGIGRRIAERLQSMGVHTALQLKHVDPRWMRRHFTVVGERLVRELNGSSCLSLEDIQEPRKSIQVSRSFATPVTHFDDLRAIVATYTVKVGEKLRSNALRTRNLLVSIRTNYHNKNAPSYSNFTAVMLPCPVEDDFNLIKASTKALEKIYRKGFAYHKAGIMAFDLGHRNQQLQGDLFTSLPIEDPKLVNLFQTIDQVNKRYGRGALFIGACGGKLSWRDRKHNLSPAYTTSWRSLPQVFAN